ncbi:MAG: exonuclease domain-containing protein [Planctomycetota bacterium]
MDFVAIDFETANNNANSACQLGLVEVRNGEITGEHCWLIRPPRLYFSPRNIAVHGIRPRQVADAPSMKELWSELAPLLHDVPVLAHNARFDIGVLVASLAAYKIKCPDLEFSCTRLIARGAWPGKARYGLKPLADWLQIRFQHHDALEDARCCAIIALAAAKEAEPSSLSAMEKALQLRRGKIVQGRIVSPTSLRKRGGERGFGGRQATDKWGFPSTRAALIGAVDSIAIKQASAGGSPLAGKRVMLLGPLRGLDMEQTKELVESLGGQFETQIGPNTNYVVACGTTLEAAGHIVCQSVADSQEEYKNSSSENQNSSVQGVRLLSERQFRALLPGGKAAAW